MPPRRSTRMSSSRLFDGSSEAGGPVDGVSSPMRNAVTGRGMSPGPAKYSSAYGSPPTVMPTRQNAARQRYSLTSALSRVIDTVDDDNERDSRERALREAEEQRRRQASMPATASQEEPAPEPELEPEPTTQPEVEQQDEYEDEDTAVAIDSEHHDATDNSVDLVSMPREEGRPKDAMEPTQEHSTPERPSGSPAHNFSEEDNIFTQARIFTPILPSRSGVVARTSHALQSLLNSARRLSARRDDADDEAVRQAYPHLNFIRPRSDQEPTPESTLPTTESAPAEKPAGIAVDRGPTLTTNSSIEPEQQQPTPTRAGGLRTLRARTATPGPGLRTRKSAPRHARGSTSDELGMDEAEMTAAARSNLARRRPQARKQAEPRPVPHDGRRQRSTSLEAGGDGDEKQGHVWWKQSAAAMWHFTLHMGEITKAIAMAITLLVLGALAVRVFVTTTASPELYEGYRMDNRLHWYGSDWRSNLGQLVPFALVHPLGALSDEEFARMNGLILSHASELTQMRRAQSLQGDTLDRVGRVLPAVVHMELDKRGRPVITQEFWHALKDSIQADQDIFTLIRRHDGALAISDLQWTALRQQLEASGMLPDANKAASKALSVHDVEDIAETTMAKSWEAWLRRNQAKVRDMLGVVDAPKWSPDAQQQQQQTDQSLERLTDKQVARLAEKMVSSSGTAREVIVSRQEFLQILQNSFVEHRVEIKGELAELEARVLDVAKAAAAAVPSSPSSSPSPPPPASGMSRKEVTRLVDQLVRKGISDAQLEAMARGKIRADWNTNLVNQVNFFSRSTGATFNHHFSSPSYQPALPFTWKRLWGRGDGSGGSLGGGGGGSDNGDDSATAGRPVPGSQRGSVVFEPWEQDGDCWCAGQGGGKTAKTAKTAGTAPQAASIAVKLGLRVVPQHLVVEHISEGATLDPGATPKDLEVWAQITDYAQQRPLQDWSLSRFPDTDERSPLFGWGFVKIGAFAYERSPAAGGVQVFRLPPELETLDAVTDHVIVRALSNHGGADHTCFYRLRLYGQVRPDVVE